MVEVGRKVFLAVCMALLVSVPALTQEEEEQPEPITSESCLDCHDDVDTKVLQHSMHADLGCQDCHQDKDTYPHRESSFNVKSDACGTCHDDVAEEYKAHGRAKVGECPDIPTCADCHGDHDILSPSDNNSKVHPRNLPGTCGSCHENHEITKKYDILIDNPVKIYLASVHGKATKGGVYVAATCNDCHSTNGSAHRILAPSFPESTINYFNIPKTCGKCHKGVEQDYWEGIHGKMVRNGEVDSPVCTTCHGEHGILPPDDPNSPVNPRNVAEKTCARCHDSAVINEKYGLPKNRLITFVDSYHGLKSKAGDPRVATCASCHGPHRILPSSDPDSRTNPAHLQETCGECHPGISAKLAQTPIHGVGGLRTKAAEIVAKIYQVAIVVIIGLMGIHWLIDLLRHLVDRVRERPQIRRMRLDEVWQHMLLAISFTVLVITGFALRYEQSMFAKVLFGWEGGFRLRGIIHRVAACVFMGTVVWHLVYLASARGRKFLKDMMPKKLDFQYFFHRILYNLGLRDKRECIQRFSYVEKAEYWALVWGTVVMVGTGLMLWFDNWFIKFLPKGALDVALTIHFYEAWLATLAILVWHMYSVVFKPEVYPMNPAWLTGTMPEEMYKEEHPGHYEEAKKETEAYLLSEAERFGKKDPSEKKKEGEEAGESKET